MTTHFEADFKGKADLGKTILCRKWALRRSYGDRTTDSSKVTCRPCAKKLGITVAVVKDDSRRGTCPCCFGSYMTRGSKMVNHGFSRPGFGFLIGRCFGVDYVRYEESCQGTRDFRNHLSVLLSGTINRLALLQCDSPEIGTLKYSYEARVSHKDISGRPYTSSEKRCVDVTHGAGVTEVVREGGTRKYRIPSYEELRQDAIRKVGYEIKALRTEIADLEAKIAGWAPASQYQQTLEAAASRKI